MPTFRNQTGFRQDPDGFVEGKFKAIAPHYNPSRNGPTPEGMLGHKIENPDYDPVNPDSPTHLERSLYFPAPRPVPEANQTLERQQPVLVDGRVQAWTVRDLTAQELDDRAVAAAAGFEDRRTAAIEQIDNDAEATRKLYLTAGEGQAMTYDRKAEEAEAYLAAGSPVAEDYPFLNAEATATDQDIAVVAATVKATSDFWITKGAEIEGLRKGGQKAVAEVAVGDDAALVTATTINWPKPD